MRRVTKLIIITMVLIFMIPGTVTAANINTIAPKVPKRLRNDFLNSGSTIRIVRSIPNGSSGHTHTSYKYRKRLGRVINFTTRFDIQIKSNVKNRKKTAAHEMGHVLDKLLSTYNPYTGDVSIFSRNNPKWLKIYRKEKRKYKPVFSYTKRVHAVSSSSEFFAESCAEYWLKPSVMKKRSRKRYNFIKQVTKAYLKSKNHGQLLPSKATSANTAQKQDVAQIAFPKQDMAQITHLKEETEPIETFVFRN